MAIRDENDNKVTPIKKTFEQVFADLTLDEPDKPDEAEVIETAIWKTDVEKAMSKIDHGRYEYCPNGKAVYDAKIIVTNQKIAREIDFEKAARHLPHFGGPNAMVFFKSPVEQIYNSVGRDICENACFAIYINKLDDENACEIALFGLRDGWLRAEIDEHRGDNLPQYTNALGAAIKPPKNVSIQGPAVLLHSGIFYLTDTQRSECLTKILDNFISNEYRLFMSDDAHLVEAPNAIDTYMETTGANEEQACRVLAQHLNAWPDGVRSYSELLDDVFQKVAAEDAKYINPAEEAISALSKLPYDDEYIKLLVAKEHWLDMKAANKKGLLYPSGPFSGMIQPGECADPDKMLEMIDAGIKNITDRDKMLKMIDAGINKATIKPLRNQSERGEK